MQSLDSLKNHLCSIEFVLKQNPEQCFYDRTVGSSITPSGPQAIGYETAIALRLLRTVVKSLIYTPLRNNAHEIQQLKQLIRANTTDHLVQIVFRDVTDYFHSAYFRHRRDVAAARSRTMRNSQAKPRKDRARHHKRCYRNVDLRLPREYSHVNWESIPTKEIDLVVDIERERLVALEEQIKMRNH